MALRSAWWCRLDSNQRQRDYESRALPPELRHRGRRSYRAARARAFTLRFFWRRFARATRFLLFIPLIVLQENQKSRGRRLTEEIKLVAEVGFEPTTFGL